MKADTLRLEVLVHHRSDFIIHRGHDLVGHFHYRHLDPVLVQVLGHFQTDKPGPHDQRPFHVVILDILLHPIGIVHVTQRENPFRVNTLQRRTHGRGPR